MKFRAGLVLGAAILFGWSLSSKRSTVEQKVEERAPASTAQDVSSPYGAPTASSPKVEAKVEVAEQSHESPMGLPDFLKYLEDLRACGEEDAQCEYPETDPRSYDFALAQDIRKTLEELRQWVLSEKFEGNLIDEVAQEWVGHHDGYVKSAALKLFATQPPNRHNLDAILKSILEDGHDEALIERTMKELQRYTDREDREKINQAFAQALLTGAPFVANEVSERLLPFITERSVQFFQDLVEQLPPGSIYRENLVSSLAKAGLITN